MIKYDKDIYYFQCVPPRPDQKEASADIAKTKYAKDDPLLASVYYHFWRYLRASPEYEEICKLVLTRQQSSEVVDYFGDLSAEGDFEQWWTKRGRDLFCEPRDLTIGRLDPESWPEKPDPIWLDGRLIVTLPIDGDTDRTIAEVRTLLSASRTKDVKRARNKSLALFQPYTTKCDVEALDRIFRIWDFQRQNSTLALYDIAIKFGAKEPKIEAEMYDWRIARTHDISSDLQTARRLMKYAALGVFPVMSKAKADGVEDHVARQRQRLGLA
jgi:hypothetical protein